jgi:hypothetical protein
MIRTGRSQFKPDVLKAFDEGMKTGVMSYREKKGMPLPDLEQGVMPGEGEGYPDLLDTE